MIKDKKIRKTFKEIIKINKKVLQKQKSLCPVCFVINKDYSFGIIMMKFPNAKSKEHIREWLQKFILSQAGIRGYIIAMDTRLSKIDIKTKEIKVFEALVHNAYTPKGSITHTAIYDEDKNFTEEAEVEDIGTSIWNVWNREEETEQMKDIEGFYYDFKKKNIEKFKDTF